MAWKHLTLWEKAVIAGLTPWIIIAGFLYGLFLMGAAAFGGIEKLENLWQKFRQPKGE